MLRGKAISETTAVAHGPPNISDPEGKGHIDIRATKSGPNLRFVALSSSASHGTIVGGPELKSK